MEFRSIVVFRLIIIYGFSPLEVKNVRPLLVNVELHKSS